MKTRPSLITSAILATLVAVGCSPAEPSPQLSAAEPDKSLASHASAAPPRKCLDGVIADLKKSWPDNAIVNIVAFGHSVPAGYGDAPIVHKRDAYPRLVEDALAEAYPTAVFNVITSAVGGSNSTMGIARLQREVLDVHPRVVMIDFGINDLVIPLADAKANLMKLVGEIRKADACPVLVTPTWYVGADEPANAQNLQRQVAMIQDVGRSMDVPVADAHQAFADFRGDKASLMATSNHPNRKGHELIAGRLIPIFVPAGDASR